MRQFVLDLGADSRNPNSDIRMMIADSVDEQPTGFGDRRKVSVG
jgi:hypothetical protein